MGSVDFSGGGLKHGDIIDFLLLIIFKITLILLPKKAVGYNLKEGI